MFYGKAKWLAAMTRHEMGEENKTSTGLQKKDNFW
jgi:hypothetical protein